MSEDVQLQKAIYESVKSTSVSSSTASGSGFRRPFSNASGSSHSYLRSAPRGPAWNAGSTGRRHGQDRPQSIDRSQSLERLASQGIMPARRRCGENGEPLYKNKKNNLRRSSTKPLPAPPPSESARSAPQAAAQAAPAPPAPAPNYGAQFDSAVVSGLTKRFGNVDVAAASAAPSGDGPCPFDRILGTGAFWAAPAVAYGGGSRHTRGALECSTSSQPCIVEYKPEAAGDNGGVRALARDSKGVRVSMKFRCAHAAPASGHIPAFHLLLGGIGEKDFVVLYTNCKDRLFTIELHNIEENEYNVQILHMCHCRELRPGILNTLVADLNYASKEVSLMW